MIQTITTSGGNDRGVVIDMNDNLRIRKLTPKECWRLMGFDDEDFEKAEKVNSNTQLYKQCGNSICVPVLEAIFKNLLDKNEHIRLLELFGGIGACTKALKRIGIDVEVVDYVEIDKYAVKSYNAINSTNFETQDIKTWNKNIYVDLIMHGSPCQDFSLAGKQSGGDKDSGTRSSLMYETIRIVEKLKPKYVIWENVKNILSKKHKHNFDNYLDKMEELGYVNYYQVLNAKDYGIPQNRERVFTVSIRDDSCYGSYEDEEYYEDYSCNFYFPPKQELKLTLKDMLENEVDEKYYIKDGILNNILSDNQAGYLSGGKWDKINESCRRYYKEDGVSPTIHTFQGGNTEPKVICKYDILDGYKQTHQAGGVYDKNGLSSTLDTMQGGWRQPCIEENKWEDLD